MTTRNLIAAAALASLGAAAIAGPSDTATPAKTRAEVRAERDAYLARTDPLVAIGESYGTVNMPASTRAADRREALARFTGGMSENEAARGEAWGDVALLESDTTGSADAYVYPSAKSRLSNAYGAASYQTASAHSGLSRAEVRAELANAIASGELDAHGETYGDQANARFASLPEQTVVIVDDSAVVASMEIPVEQPPLQDADQTIVMWIPVDDETVSLLPGEALLLVSDGE